MPLLRPEPTTTWREVVAGGRTGDRPRRAASATVRVLGAAPWLLVISRALGAVVVTVQGPLNGRTSLVLRDALSDLIDGQGNLLVVVNVRRMIVADPTSLEVLVVARLTLEARGGRFLLTAPSAATSAALRAGGLGAAIELHPERRYHPSSG